MGGDPLDCGSVASCGVRRGWLSVECVRQIFSFSDSLGGITNRPWASQSLRLGMVVDFRSVRLNLGFHFSMSCKCCFCARAMLLSKSIQSRLGSVASRMKSSGGKRVRSRLSCSHTCPASGRCWTACRGHGVLVAWGRVSDSEVVAPDEGGEPSRYPPVHLFRVLPECEVGMVR